MTEAESISRRRRNGLQSPVPYPLKQHRELIAGPPPLPGHGATTACDSGTGSRVHWPLAPCLSFSGLGVTLEVRTTHTEYGELARSAPPCPNLAFSECPLAGSGAQPSKRVVTQETRVCMALLWASRMLRPGILGWVHRASVWGPVTKPASVSFLLGVEGAGPCTSSSLSLLLWGDRGGPFGICLTLTGLETRTLAAPLLAAGCGLGIKCTLSSAPAARRPPSAILSFV